jgi:hypothetical protein
MTKAAEIAEGFKMTEIGLITTKTLFIFPPDSDIISFK